MNRKLISLAVLISSSLFAGPDSSYQAKFAQYCKDKASCTDEKQQIAEDLKMVATCNDYYKTNRCEEVKDALGQASANKIMTCDTASFCQSDDLNVVQCTIDGIKTQFTIPGLTMLMGSVVGGTIGGLGLSSTVIPALPFLTYEAGKSAEACNKDIKFKKMAVKIHNLNLMEDEKPLDVEDKDKALLNLQCADLTSFLRTRLDTIANRRIEKQSWSLDGKVSKQSPMAKSLLETLHSTKCYRPSQIKENLCQFAAALITGGGLYYGASKGLVALAAKNPAVASLIGQSAKSLTDAERIAWAESELSSSGKLNAPLTDAQKKAIIDAHNVGKGQIGKDGVNPAGPHNWTTLQLDEKRNIVLASGLTLPQWGVLRKSGVTGYDFPFFNKNTYSAHRRDLVGMPEHDKIVVYQSEKLNERLIAQGWDTKGVYANGYDVHMFTARGNARMNILEPEGELYANTFKSSVYKANSKTPVKLKGFYSHSADNFEVQIAKGKVSGTIVKIKLYEHEVTGIMVENKALMTVQTRVPGELKYHEIFEEGGNIVYRAVFKKPNGDLVKRTQHVDPKSGELTTIEKDAVIADTGQFKAR